MQNLPVPGVGRTAAHRVVSVPPRPPRSGYKGPSQQTCVLSPSSKRQLRCEPGLRVVPFPLQREEGEGPDNISETKEGKDVFIDPEPRVSRIIPRKGFPSVSLRLRGVG